MTSPDKPLMESQQQRYLHGEAAVAVAGNGASWQAQQHPAGVGEMTRQSTGVTPAPPPPGFKSDKSTSDGNNNNQQQQQEQNNNQDTSSNHRLLSGGSALSAEMAQMGGGRTSSFVNLAAMLGTGLAESMDDATKGDWSQQQHLLQGQLARSVSHEDVPGLNFARQSRHAAARLIGASPPRVETNLGGLEGGTFLPGGGRAPPATLGGAGRSHAVPSSSASHQGISHTKNNNEQSASGNSNNSLQGGFLSAAFSNPAAAGAEAEDMFGNRRAMLPNSGDVGLTVMEPGSEQQRAAALGDLVQEQQQQVYCSDPHCQDQPPYHSYDQQQQLQNNSPDRDAFEVERGMRHLWVDDSASVGLASRHSDLVSRQSQSQQPPPQQQQQSQSQTLYLDTQSVGNSSQRSGASQSPRQVSEADIRPFIWDTRLPQQQQQQQRQPEQGNVEPSRCLTILRAVHLQIPEVRSTCEAFGVVESFRSDFADRGIIFVSYYDIRSAQYAALELEGMLRRRDSSQGSGEVAVYYCVPLNSSTQTDESRLVLADIPAFVEEHSLLPMLSSYGAVRSLRKQGGNYGGSSYEVEFHNLQDAKQALLELSATQPWGPDVAVEVSMRPPIDRKRGREMLAVIGRWRRGGSANRPNISPAASIGDRRFEAPPRLDHRAPVFRGPESSTSSSPALAAPAETQLVLGPDGRYSYMVVNNQPRYGQPSSSEYNAPHNRQYHQQEQLDQQRQQVVHGPNGEIYLTTAPPAHQPPSHRDNYRRGGPPSRDYYQPSSQQPHGQSQYSNAQYNAAEGRDRLERISGPYYAHQVAPARQDHHGGRHHHHHPHSSNASNASVGGDDKDNKHLVLDLDGVEHGRDSRTSLMVRNIPNKYTQQMLLAEFTENGMGPGVIDFFYLPIDFKNRCNRGYAFINFVDFKDILPFHQRYFGKHWSTFNSDKICDITYARIQGKAAMLKRFENSALMEKDEEYKPLVFISHGPEKGKRLGFPFPEATAAAIKN